MKKLFRLFSFTAPFIVSSIFSVFFLSCEKEESKDVNQDKIYAEYELFYDKNTDKTIASAVFKFSNDGGTQLKLTSPSEIRFGSDTIPYDPLFAYYRKEYAGFVNSGTFTFKDTDGKTYSNLVTLANSITNPTIDTLKRTGAYTYTWLGDPLATNESLSLVIASASNGLNFQLFLQGLVGSKDLVLPINQLNQLPIGLCNCQLERQIETKAKNVSSAGGEIRGKYRALNKTLFVK